MTAPSIDQVRLWKDEDYREQLGLGLDGHPSGDINLSDLRVNARDESDTTVITITFTWSTCQSIVWCTSLEPPVICSTKLCHDELANSRN